MSHVIRALYISQGHNFFGHHGQAAGTNPAIEVPEVECITGRGLRGDRFFDHKADYKGQITFFSEEVYAGLCESLDLWEKSRGVLRRNVFVEGVDLNSLVGIEFVIQGICFRGMAECSPCHWMDEAFGPGAETFLKGQGGLRAKILSNGILRASRDAAALDFQKI